MTVLDVRLLLTVYQVNAESSSRKQPRMEYCARKSLYAELSSHVRQYEPTKVYIRDSSLFKYLLLQHSEVSLVLGADTIV